jgi:DNA-binding HxlR family transcriptional regulator
LYYLFQGKNRFGQLQKAMPGISPKTLSLRLKELENEIIITKKIFAEVPLHVEYSLTPRGQLLFKIIHAMDEWGSENPNNRIDPKVKHFK